MSSMSTFSPEQSSWLGLGDCGFEASSDPNHLLDPNFYYNAVSWSTTDPTLLLTDQRHQQQQRQRQHNAGEMQFAMGLGGGCSNSNVSCDSNMGPADDMGFEAGSCQSFASNTAHAPAVAMLAAQRMNLHVDRLDGGRSIGSGHALSSSSRSMDPFSFCGGGGGGGGGGSLHASPHSQFTTNHHNMCSLPSDQLYYSCADALMLPKLVSDPFSDSCGSSDKGRSTSSGEITWMNGSSVTTTLDPLLQLQQMSDGLVPMLPRSVLGPFKPHQHRAHTLDGLHNVQRALPLSLQSPSQQTYSSNSSMSARYNSGIYPIMPALINPGALVDNSSSSSSNVGGSFGKSFHSFSTGRLPHQQGVVAASPSSTMPAAAAGGMTGGFKEFNVGGGFESQRDYSSNQLTLLSASRKPTATSVEPQSVAARQRRKKITERVRVLEKLIPGGNKMDTASMLDEAIEYVKFLQLQVQLLESMGEPEAPPNSSTTAAAAVRIGHNNNSSCGQFYPNSNDKCKIDGSGLSDGGFGSSSHLSRSASLMQQVTLAAAAAATATNNAKSTTTPPLILSEVLQEQLFKRKLCLVSLTQYCPQQQARRSC